MTRAIFNGYFKLRYKIFKRDSFTCQYCGSAAPEVTLHVDHIVAVVDGGDDSEKNLITSCSACNIGKEHLRVSEAGYHHTLTGRKKPSYTQTRVYNKLEEIGPVDYKQLAIILRMNKNSVAVTLTRLKRKGKVFGEGGLWMILDHRLEER